MVVVVVAGGGFRMGRAIRLANMAPAQREIALMSATTSPSDVMSPAVLERLLAKRRRSSMALTG